MTSWTTGEVRVIAKPDSEQVPEREKDSKPEEMTVRSCSSLISTQGASSIPADSIKALKSFEQPESPIVAAKAAVDAISPLRNPLKRELLG